MSDAARNPSSNVTPLRPKQAQANTRINSIPPARRAAVVIAMLGHDAARPIVEKLDDAALAQVAAELEAVSYLDREELTEIVMDFLQTLRATHGSFRGGKSRAREIVSGFIDESRIDHVFGGGPKPRKKPEASAETADVWKRLEGRKPAVVADYLNRLTPNIISIILRKLDVSVASEIVGNLNEGKLDATIGYMVGREPADPEIEAVVGQMVEIEFLNQAQAQVEEDEGGDMEPVSELLSLLPAARRDRLMSFLKIEHEDKFHSLEKLMFTVDNLADMLPRQSVPVVFKELGEERMIPFLSTLSGSQEPLHEYLLSNISSRLATQYRDTLADPNLPAVADPELEQRNFLTSLMALKRRGLITIEKASG